MCLEDEWFDAVNKGELNKLEECLKKGLSVNVLNEQRNSALHIAAKKGDLQTIKWLLVNRNSDKASIKKMSSSSLERTGEYDRTPFLFAAEFGQLEVMKYLAQRGANIRATDAHAQTAMHLASASGNAGSVEWLFSHRDSGVMGISDVPDIYDGLGIETRDCRGYTPFLTAAAKGQLSVLKTLNKRSAKKRVIDNEGNTALHLASEHSGNIDVVKWLLSQRNDDELHAKNFETGLALESKGKHARTPLLSSACGGRLSIFLFFLKLGADLTAKDSVGNSILHLVCKSGNLSFVEYLFEHLKLRNHWSLEERGQDYRTPLLCAAVKGHFELVQWLVRQGADTRVIDKMSCTALHLASSSGNHQLVDWLLSQRTPIERSVHGRNNGLGLERKAANGNTPFLCAARDGRLEILQLLVELEVDTRVTNLVGDNALHLACYANSLPTLIYLIETVGLNVKSKDRGGSGYTTLNVVKQRVSKDQKSSKIIDYLEQKSIEAKQQRAGYLEKMKHFKKSLKKLETNALIQLDLDGEYLTKDDINALLVMVRKSEALQTLHLGNHVFILSGADFAYLDDRFWGVLKEFISNFQTNCTVRQPEKIGVWLTSLLDEQNTSYQAFGELLVRCYGFTKLHLAALLGQEALCTLFINDGERFLKDRLDRYPEELANEHGYLTLSRYLKEQREQNQLPHFMKDRVCEQQRIVDLTTPKEQLSTQLRQLSMNSQHSLLSVGEIQRYWLGIQRLRQLCKSTDIFIKGLDTTSSELKSPHQWLNEQGLNERRLEKNSMVFKPLQSHIERLKKLYKFAQSSGAQGQSVAKHAETVVEVLKQYCFRLCQLAAHDRLSKMKVPALMFGAGLTPQLLDEKVSHIIIRQGVSDSEYGTSSVHELNDIHFKRDPYAPGVEFMVGHLSQLIMGEGTTPTELLKVIDSEGRAHSFIASKTVVGINLEDVLKRYPGFVEKIDKTNFSLMILLSLLTDPEDAKPDNYMAELEVEQIGGKESLKSVRIIGIDNDIAFAAPIVMSHGGYREGVHYVNVKNVLYFFPQMSEAIDQKARKAFLSREPELVMFDWLLGLYNKNEEYLELRKQGIFSQEEFETGGRNGRGLQLPIRLEPGTTLKLYQKLTKLRDLLEQNSSITHMELFRSLQPILQRFYFECAEIAKAKSQFQDSQIKDNYDQTTNEEKLKDKQVDETSAIQGLSSDALSSEERYAYIWKSIKMLYQLSAPGIEDVVNLRSHIHTSQASSVMTSIALKTVQHRGYEQKRILDIAQATEEYIGGINYARIGKETGQSMLNTIKKLAFIKQPLWRLAAIHQNVGMMKFLTEFMEPMNVESGRGLTVLHLSASVGDKLAVSYLLKQGMSPEVRDNINQTPLDKALNRLKQLETSEQVEKLKANEQVKKKQLLQVVRLLEGYESDQIDSTLPLTSQNDLAHNVRLLKAEERLEHLKKKGDIKQRLADVQHNLKDKGVSQEQRFAWMTEEWHYQRLQLKYIGELLPPLLGLNTIELEQYVTLTLMISHARGVVTPDLSGALCEVETRIRKLKQSCIKEEGEGSNYHIVRREMTVIEFEQWVILEYIRAAINKVPLCDISQLQLQAQSYLRKLENQVEHVASDDYFAQERESTAKQQTVIHGILNRLKHMEQETEQLFADLTLSQSEESEATDSQTIDTESVESTCGASLTPSVKGSREQLNQPPDTIAIPREVDKSVFAPRYQSLSTIQLSTSWQSGVKKTPQRQSDKYTSIRLSHRSQAEKK